MSKGRRSTSWPITIASFTVALIVALLVGWILLIIRNWRLTQVIQDVWLLVAGVISFVLIGTVLVFFVTFLVREIWERRKQESFIDSVTHELKSPLASLRLCIETLQRHHLPPDRAEQILGMMVSDVDRLSTFVDDILESSRVHFGNRPMQAEEISVTELAMHCIERISRRYKLSEGEIQSHFEADVVLVSDPTMLEVILINLLDNAVKYSDAPYRVAIRVSLPDVVFLKIEVSDYGIGIPPDMRRRIFERFFRAPGELVHQRRGTGLGLYVVQSLVRELGGHIKAMPNPHSAGTCITVMLPREGQ